jgi:integrase/recombinase XerC
VGIFKRLKTGLKKSLGRGIRGALKKIQDAFLSPKTKRKKLAVRKRPSNLISTSVPESIDRPVENPPFLTQIPIQISAPNEVLVSGLEALHEFSGVQLSAHTQRAYKNDLKDFFMFLKISGFDLNRWAGQVGPAHVAQFRGHLLSKGLSRTSVTRKLAVLKSFYKWAHARGWVDSNPAELVKAFPQNQESKTGYLDDGEIGKLLRHLPQVDDARLSKALFRVAVETLLMLGIRRGEATKIATQDLEFLDGLWLVRIQGKGDRDRRLPVPEVLAATWALWWQRVADDAPKLGLYEAPELWMDWCRRAGQQPLLIATRGHSFRGALSTSELARVVRKACRQAGLMKRVSPHMLRATAITHALDQGASHRGVQQMAGWTSPLMITRYDKRRKDPKQSAVHKLKYAHRPIADAPTTAQTTEQSL